MSLGQLREHGSETWDVGWDSLVPSVSLGQLGGWETGMVLFDAQPDSWPESETGSRDKGWDRLVLSMSLSHRWGHGETGMQEMGQGMGQFGTNTSLGGGTCPKVSLCRSHPCRDDITLPATFTRGLDPQPLFPNPPAMGITLDVL